jgi:hypothetical protein
VVGGRACLTSRFETTNHPWHGRSLSSAKPETAPGATVIIVRAPGEVRALIEKHIELQRYRAVDLTTTTRAWC